ncbi:hypothetical protein CVT25_010241 [Psilocybe cyanescens]|uniref:YDG domain-containing protein n=1 Tax=Psilocybe cyanescens TaxID=93625 RepID=A0A409XD34_PSICY|nr:hypothetical protein CVT25_010241 [Psilocybe cyanescens]
MSSAYEKARLENIRKNRELLIQLGLDKPLLEPTEIFVKKPAATKKRKLPDPPLNEEAESDAKAQRVSLPDTAPESGVRRSSRNAGKIIDYKKEIIKGSPIPVAYSSGVKVSENEGPMGREDGPRRYDPKTYGSIPDIVVGTWWPTRQGCSADSIHAPWVGGISGGKQGAYSVALSGGYDDDVDLGYAFTYTGSGGRDLKGTKNAPKNLRTAPQSSDQTFENNASQTEPSYSDPAKPRNLYASYYAPTEGYNFSSSFRKIVLSLDSFRYDGLYRVEKAWMEKGINAKGYLVCKFAFKRLPNQPPLPKKASEDTNDVANSQEEILDDKKDVVDGKEDVADVSEEELQEQL